MLQGDHAVHQRGVVWWVGAGVVFQVTLIFWQIVDVCLRMLSHDPNYNYDSDGEEGGDEAMEDDMDAEDFEEK